MYVSKNARKASLFSLIKIAAKKSEDLDALRKIFVSKYPGERAAQGFAVQYYNKFIKTSDPSVNLTEENLPQPLPQTIEEIKLLLQTTETVGGKTKKEELAENLKSKYPNVDFTNLNEDYLSWLHQRYIENKTKSGEIVHPIEEAMETLKKFPSIQAKYRASQELKNKVEGAGYEDISYVGNLTLDDMEKIITLDTSDLTVRVEGVEIKDEEFLGKFGEWNLWLPRTKETSVKIAGYDEKYNPKTTWCTARTRGSNLFYGYIGRKDIPIFLFYIIKDNPEDANDWLSLGYAYNYNLLSPDFSGRDGGLSVNRDNRGLREKDYLEILGKNWSLIKSKIESEIEKHKVIEDGIKRYISPARSIINKLAKNLEEFKKELGPKSNKEKEDFIGIILSSEPSAEVIDECAKILTRITSAEDFLYNYSHKDWAKPYIDSAAKILIKKDCKNFLVRFKNESWSDNYLDLALNTLAYTDPDYFLDNLSTKDWAQTHLGLAAKILADRNPKVFIRYYSYKPWAQPYVELARTKLENLKNNRAASSKIKNKLIKLSNFLKSNNLEEYKEINYLNIK